MDCRSASVVARRPADQPNTHHGEGIPPLRAGVAPVHPNRTDEDSLGYEHRWGMLRLPGQPVGAFNSRRSAGYRHAKNISHPAGRTPETVSSVPAYGEKGCGSTVLPQQRCPAAVFVVVDL